MINIALVAAGGAIGSVFRYLVGVWSVRLAGANFPWGTLAVNVAGSFMIGFLVELVARRLNASMEMRLFLVTGVLGGFTTFSSFSGESLALLQAGRFGAAVVHTLTHVLGSLALAAGGYAVGRAWFA